MVTYISENYCDVDVNNEGHYANDYYYYDDDDDYDDCFTLSSVTIKTVETIFKGNQCVTAAAASNSR